jgi:hypothetical protein
VACFKSDACVLRNFFTAFAFFRLLFRANSCFLVDAYGDFFIVSFPFPMWMGAVSMSVRPSMENG